MRLIRKDIKRLIAASKLKYFNTYFRRGILFLSTSLDKTKAECKYKLWGIMIAPIKATIAEKAPD